MLANTPDAARRMLWMHIAVTVGLFGFLFPGFMAIKEWVSAHGGPLAHPAAAEEQAVMAVICLIFTALCVRSFIAARRSRAA
jgi:heme/copper-type cytochrome/quinol oxidase subunit 3